MSVETLIDRVQTSSQIEQRLIDNLLDASPQFKEALATLLRESKHHQKLSQYWQAAIDVALVASHASNVTAHPHANSIVRVMTTSGIVTGFSTAVSLKFKSKIWVIC
jgi:hypothetical protein